MINAIEVMLAHLEAGTLEADEYGPLHAHCRALQAENDRHAESIANLQAASEAQSDNECDLRAEIAELQSLANTRGQNCVALTLELDSARERIKSLESWQESAVAVFRPFAAMVMESHSGIPDDRTWYSFNDNRISHGDLRRLASLVLSAPFADSKPKTLRDFGYAPGEYSGTCLHCKQKMEDVDKRCRCCKPCAERLLAQSQPLAGEPT